MNASKKVTMLTLLSILVFSAAPSFAANYQGQVCRRTDTDPIKCLVCVQAWEANNSSYADMQRVVGVAKTRYNSGRYPKSFCKIAYQRGQFIGLRHGKVLNKPASVLALMVKAARNTKANGALGFRTGKNGQNRLRKKADLPANLMPVAPNQFAEAAPAPAAPAVAPAAPEASYEQTAFLEDDGAATATN